MISGNCIHDDQITAKTRFCFHPAVSRLTQSFASWCGALRCGIEAACGGGMARGSGRFRSARWGRRACEVNKACPKNHDPMNPSKTTSQSQSSTHPIATARVGLWRRRTARIGTIALLAVACLQSMAAPAPNVPAPAGVRDITIFDQNLFVGAEFTPLLGLDPSDPNYGLKLLMGVAQTYQAIIASDFPKRATAIAGEIAATQPDLVALQEVSLLRMQVPGDAIAGGHVPATAVQLDYLGILLDNLQQRGLHYAAVAIVTNLDLEMPMPTTTPGVFADVRLTDHDVILARTDLPPGHLRVGNSQSGNFHTALPLPNLGASIARGWCAVDVTTRGRTFRFINAHLEENTAAVVQAAQAQELLQGPALTRLPVIMAGDFNSDANGTDGTLSYSLLTQTFTDTWSAVHPGDAGLTWGHDPLLADPTVAFVWRLDLILFRGAQFQPLSMVRLSPQFQAVPPLWPSDHAGLAARLRLW